MTQNFTPPTRRRFLRRALQATGLAAVSSVVALGYGFWEASQIRVRRQTVSVKHLPRTFHDMTIAILTDFHHGPFVSLDFIQSAFRIANDLKPDLFALLGDYAHKGYDAHQQLPPCIELLAQLQAPLGCYAVPGNHDMPQGGALYRDVMKTSPLHDITNTHIALKVNGENLYLAGVDDLYWGKPDLTKALNGIPNNSAIVLLAHNPDFAEEVPDERVGLMLSGHLHGGQIYIPEMGSVWLPTKYGKKYQSGLVRGPASDVFVSRGLGEAGVPLRMNCPPEINLLSLQCPA